jgi:hypothetical protein
MIREVSSGGERRVDRYRRRRYRDQIPWDIFRGHETASLSVP